MMSNNSSLSHRREKNKSDSSSKHKQSGKNPKISSPNTKIPNSDLEHAIIQYLQNHQEPQRTIAISKAVGGGTSKFVNPSLYKLMGERILHQTNKQPPLWALNPTHTAMNHRFNSHYSMPHHNHFNGFQSRGFDPQSVVYESQHTFEVQNYFRDQGRSFSPQNQRYQFPSHASCERMQSSNLVGSQTGGAHRYPSYHGNTQRRGHSSRTWKNIGEQRRVHTPHPEMYKINNHSGRIHDTAQRSADQLLKNTIKDRDQEMRKINKHNDSIHDTAQGSADELFKNTIKDKDAPGAYKKTSSNQASLTNSSARNTALVSNTPTASTQDYIPTSSLSDKDNQQPGGNNSSQNAGNASFDSESEEDDLQYRVSDVMNSLPRPVDLDDGSDYESDSEYEDMDEDWGGSDEVTAFSALGDEAEEQWAGYGPTTSSNDAVVKDEPASTYSPIEKNKIVRPPSPAQLLQAKTNFNAAENAPKENSRNESTGFTDTISTSLMPWLKVNLSSMPQPVPISATTSLPRTQPESLTLGQQLLKEGKTCVEGMEYLVLSDETEMQAPPSQQQRRPPLLSTPLVRGSNPSPSLYSPSFGYRFPFQPVSQEQPSTNSPTQPSLNNEQNESLPAQPKLQITAESFAALNKNPISAFMEYAQSRHLAATIDPIDQQGPSHKPVFVYAAKLGNRIFPYISSNNKKDGKKEAAEQAIRILIAEGQYHLPQQISIMKMPESSMTDHDKIAAKVHQTYNQLIATVPESFPGRKVIAGMVMEIDSIDSSQVVSIGSGNRCITGDKLSQEGNTVNDCHAEIIARRGLMSFLWDQVISYSANQKSSILEFSPATGKLRVKSDVKFHLYISTAPCGDGALFSPRDVKSNNSPLTDGSVHHPVYTNNAHGVLRTKMEGGEGTIPIESSYKEQAWDGLITGERLRTMSCSDKICRWNVLGMQGALLGHFLDPIYLASITLGYLYDHSHLCRAVCCRLDRENQSINEQLPRPYHLNHPVLGRVTACDPPRETQKTKSYSVNWRLGEDRPEVLDGSLGICYSALEKNMFSRLSKKNLFDKFKRACAVHKRSDLPMGATYYTTKRANASFLQAKEAMFRKFKSTGCGKWISKPQEEEMFS